MKKKATLARKIYLTITILIIINILIIKPAGLIYNYVLYPKWFRFKLCKWRALSYHREDGKQYHVWDNEGKYIVVSRRSIKDHNKIAKRDSRYKSIDYLTVCREALYSTPLKSRTQL